MTCPYEPAWSRAVYHLYVVRTGDRDGLMEHLKEAGIGTGIHYPVPLHLQKAYASLGYKPDDLPVCTRVAAEIVSLPMFPQLTAAAAGARGGRDRELHRGRGRGRAGSACTELSMPQCDSRRGRAVSLRFDRAGTLYLAGPLVGLFFGRDGKNSDPDVPQRGRRG